MQLLSGRAFRAAMTEDGAETIVGDPTTPGTFSPRLILRKWAGQHYWVLLPTFAIPSATLTIASSRLTWANTSIGVYWDDLGAGEVIKFGLVLKVKPATNTWVFQLGGQYQECDFFYQPIMANVNPDGSSWENDAGGHRRETTAEHGGSYAVYHKVKRDCVVGGTNYKIGKLGDLLRPKFTDAIGTSAWATLAIDPAAQTYRVTVPQAFLDAATYPVTVNDTFGNTAIPTYSEYDNWGENIIYCRAFSTPAAAGTTSTITAYLRWGDHQIQFCPAIYSDSPGQPSARLAADNTTGVALANTNAWKTAALVQAVTLGTQYWLAFKPETGASGNCTIMYYRDVVDNNLYYSNSGGKSNYPDPAGPAALTVEHSKAGIYATYSTAPAGARYILGSH